MSLGSRRRDDVEVDARGDIDSDVEARGKGLAIVTGVRICASLS